MDTRMEEIHESVASEPATSNSNVQVVVRVRPPNSREQEQGYSKCLDVDKAAKSISMTKPQAKNFTFDFVADEEVMQEELFTHVGKPITDACMQGYHCCLLAYGQTGSGKTYTMEGPDCDENFLPSQSNNQGLIPRIFKYIFSSMAATKDQDYDNVQFEVKCSYLQIYNEQVSDLLDTNSQNLSIREDSKRGMFVDGLQEVVVSSAETTYSVFKRGSQNRQTGMTAMNEESSRSHSVFTIKMASQRRNEGGLMKRRTSNFYLVDLAGSERQKQSEAVGLRLKEAGSINKSLSALGNVIKALVDIAEGKIRHVPYRDSKLTFLLKDALGGNSKCSLVANISPAEKSADETLSTLKFAQRAKLMRNDAVVNEDMFGNPAIVAEMLRKMKLELAYWKAKCGDTTAGGHPPEALQPIPQESENATISRLAKLVVNDHRGEMRARDELNKQVAQHRAEKECHGALVERYQKEIKSLKLVVKLRDENIKRLGAAHPSPTRDEELTALQEEIDALRSQLEHHPDVLRFKMELDEAKEILEELEDETRSREALKGDLEAETKMKLDLSILLEDIQNENKALLTKVEAAESEASRVKQALESREEHFRAAEQKVAQATSQLAVAEDELNQAMQRCDIAEANTIQMTQELSQQKSHMSSTYQEQSRLQEDMMMELERLTGVCEQTKSENDKIYPELERVQFENTEMATTLATLNAQVAELEHAKTTAVENVQIVKRETDEQLQKSATLLAEWEAKVESISAENSSLTTQLEVEVGRADEAEQLQKTSGHQIQELNDLLAVSEAGRISSEEKSGELRGLLAAAEEERAALRLARSIAETEFQAALQEAAEETASARATAADCKRAEEETVGRFEGVKQALEALTAERDDALSMARAAEDQAAKVESLQREVEELQRDKDLQAAQVIELARQVGESNGKTAGAEEKQRRADEKVKLVLVDLNESRAQLEREAEALANLKAETGEYKKHMETKVEQLQEETRKMRADITKLEDQVDEEKWRCQMAEDRRMTAEGALQEAEKMRRVVSSEAEELRVGLEAGKEAVVVLERKLKEASEAEAGKMSALTEALSVANERSQGMEERLCKAEDREKMGRAEVEAAQTVLMNLTEELRAAQVSARSSEEAERSLHAAMEGMANTLADKEREAELAQVRLRTVQEMLDVTNGKLLQEGEKIAKLEKALREVMETSTTLEEENKKLCEDESVLKLKLAEIGKCVEVLPSLERELKHAEEKMYEQEQRLKAGNESLAQLTERAHADLEEKVSVNEKLMAEKNELQTDVMIMQSKLKELHDMESKLEALQGEHKAIMAALQAQGLQTIDEVALLAKDAMTLQEEAVGLNSELQVVKATVQTMETEKESLLQALAVKEEELKFLVQEQQRAEEKLKALDEAQGKERDCLVRCADREKEVEELRSKIGELNNLTKGMRDQNEAQALQFSQMKDEQRSNEIRLQEVNQRHSHTLADVEGRVATLQLEHTAAQASLEKGVRDLAVVLDELAAERYVSARIHEERGECEKEIGMLKEALEERDARVDEVQRDTDDAIKTVMEQMSQQNIKNGTLQGRIKELESHVGQLQWEAHGVEGLELDKKKLRGKLKEAMEREQEGERRLKASNVRVGTLEVQLQKLQGKLEGTEDMLKAAQKKWSDVEGKLQDLQDLKGLKGSEGQNKLLNDALETETQKDCVDPIAAPKSSLCKSKKRPSTALSTTPSPALPAPGMKSRLSSLRPHIDTNFFTPAFHPAFPATPSSLRAGSESIPMADDSQTGVRETSSKSFARKLRAVTCTSPIVIGETPSPPQTQSEEVVANLPRQKKIKIESKTPGSQRKPLMSVELNIEPHRSSPAVKTRQYNLRQRANEPRHKNSAF